MHTTRYHVPKAIMPPLPGPPGAQHCDISSKKLKQNRSNLELMLILEMIHTLPVQQASPVVCLTSLVRPGRSVSADDSILLCARPLVAHQFVT